MTINIPSEIKQHESRGGGGGGRYYAYLEATKPLPKENYT